MCSATTLIRNSSLPSSFHRRFFSQIAATITKTQQPTSTSQSSTTDNQQPSTFSHPSDSHYHRRPVSPLVAQRRLLAASTRHHISHQEFLHSKMPFPAPVVAKLPVPYRMPSGAFLMKQLVAEERNRLITQFPKHIEVFKAGDKIAIVKYLSLSDRVKRERLFGVVIAKHGNYPVNVNAAVTIRNIKYDEAYEMKIPLHSPLVVRLDVLESSDNRRFSRRKRYELRDADRSLYDIRIPTSMPVEAHEDRLIVTVEEEQQMKEERRTALRLAARAEARKKKADKKAKRLKN